MTKRNQDPPFDHHSLRSALKFLSESDWQGLGLHPLAKLGLVKDQLAKKRYESSQFESGLYVKDILIESIERLRPEITVADPTEKSWRLYRILNGHFVKKISRHKLINELGIGKSTYDHALSTAIKQLENIIREQEQIYLHQLHEPARHPGDSTGSTVEIAKLTSTVIDGKPPTIIHSSSNNQQNKVLSPKPSRKRRKSTTRQPAVANQSKKLNDSPREPNKKVYAIPIPWLNKKIELDSLFKILTPALLAVIAILLTVIVALAAAIISRVSNTPLPSSIAETAVTHTFSNVSTWTGGSTNGSSDSVLSGTTDMPMATHISTQSSIPIQTPTGAVLVTASSPSNPSPIPSLTPTPVATLLVPTNTTLPHTPTASPTQTATPSHTPTFTASVTDTSSATSTDTPTPTDVPENLGQVTVCNVAGAGVEPGTLFTINVNDTSYSVPAANVDGGFCILAGEFPLKTEVTVQEVIPSGYIVTRIRVKPESRVVSKDVSLGKVVIKIGKGVTEVIFTNKVDSLPTSTPTAIYSPTPILTSTPTLADHNLYITSNVSCRKWEVSSTTDPDNAEVSYSPAQSGNWREDKEIKVIVTARWPDGVIKTEEVKLHKPRDCDDD